MRVTKDVVNAIANKFSSLAHAKIASIPEPKRSSEDTVKDLQKFIAAEVMKELPSILAAYQKKHPAAKFNTLFFCKNVQFDYLDSCYHLKPLVKLDEEKAYEEKIKKVRELKDKAINDIVLRLPFIKTQKEYDEYLAEVEKQFK